MERCLKGLIIAEPGRVRDGLQALLTAIPQMGRVEQAGDTSSALRTIRKQQPTLVLLDFSLIGDDLRTLLKRIKAESPQTQSLVLVDDAEQQQEAKASGADRVLIKGFTAEKLIETIGRLLPPQGS